MTPLRSGEGLPPLCNPFLRRCAGADHLFCFSPLAAAYRMLALAKVKATSNSAARGPRKTGNATIKDFYNAACERYEGDLKYRDPSNLKLPLRSCDIDRFKPAGGYDAARPGRAGNFRLFLGPFNDIRSDAVNNRYPRRYIMGVSNFKSRRIDRERAEDTRRRAGQSLMTRTPSTLTTMRRE